MRVQGLPRRVSVLSYNCKTDSSLELKVGGSLQVGWCANESRLGAVDFHGGPVQPPFAIFRFPVRGMWAFRVVWCELGFGRHFIGALDKKKLARSLGCRQHDPRLQCRDSTVNERRPVGGNLINNTPTTPKQLP